MKHITQLLTRLFALTMLASLLMPALNSQTLTVGEVHSYQPGDEFAIRSRGYTGPDEFSIEKILNRTDFGTDSVQFEKQVITYNFDLKYKNWVRSETVKKYTIKGLNNAHFTGFGKNDTIMRYYNDSGKQLISYYSLTEVSRKDSCGTILNERHDSNWTILSGEAFTIIRAYKGLGVLIYSFQHQSNITILLDQEFVYYKINGVTCGDTNLQLRDPLDDIRGAVIPESLGLYPNPSDNMVFFTSPENLNVKVFDASGKLLMIQDISSGTGLDISHLSGGVYIIEVIAEGHTYKKIKLLKS